VRARGRTREVRATATGAPPPVRLLITSAWGVGGTIRTSFTTAAHLAETHDVEVVSVLRSTVEPGLPVPAGLRMRALFDGTNRRWTPRNLLALLLYRTPSRLWHPLDGAFRHTSLWSDIVLVRWLTSLPAGTIAIATRPALILVLSRLAPADVYVVAQEHQKLGHHPADLRTALAAALPNCSLMATLTESDRADYAAFVGPDGPPVVAVPNAVPDAAMGPGDPAAHRLIAAGRLVNQKGYDLLLRAFAEVAPRHPDWRLDIFGRGNHHARLEQAVLDLGLTGRARINPPTDRLGERMAEASTYVLSSRFEGFPLVLLEAMAAGLAVVSFDCPTGPNEIVTDGVDGLLVPPEDVGALAAALDRVMADEALRRRFAAAAPAAVRRYSSSEVGQRWDALLAPTSVPTPRPPFAPPAPRPLARSVG
jgi:glycosyltransferase involved in cell wall biosynthesis